MYEKTHFPWFIGDTFIKMELDIDGYNGFELLILCCWLIVFIATSYFIFIDSGSWAQSLLHFLSVAQYVATISICHYFRARKHFIMDYAPHISAVFCFVVNGSIWSLNRYLCPKSGEMTNALCCLVLFAIYFGIFVYEEMVHSIYVDKLVSISCELALCFGFLLFLTKYKSYAEIEQLRENKRMSEKIYKLSMELNDHNAVVLDDQMIYRDESSSEESDSETSTESNHVLV